MTPRELPDPAWVWLCVAGILAMWGIVIRYEYRDARRAKGRKV